MPRRSHWFQALALLCFAGSARAEGKWQESHRTQDDVRITVAKDGTAQVEEQIRYRVVAGRMKAFDIKGIDADALLTPEVEVTAEDGSRFTAHAEFAADPKSEAKKKEGEESSSVPVVRVTVDEIQGARDRGLPRGIYAFNVIYKVDLVATHRLERDGSMWRVTWTSLPAPDGRDGVRAVIVLPQAPTEPRPDAPRDGNDTVIASVKRSTEKDEVELVRAHVPRDESVAWRVRVDPKALPAVVAKELQIPPPPPPPPPKRLPDVFLALCVALSALVSFALASRKLRSVEKLAKKSENAPRPLVSVPGRAWVFSLFFTLGILTAAVSLPIVGAIFLLLAGVVMTFLPGPNRRQAWGPGKWLSVTDQDAFSPGDATLDSWDASTSRGAAFAFCLFGLAIALGVGLGMYVPVLRLVLPISWLALAPVFLTGTAGQMAPSASSVASFLRPIFARLKSESSLRVSPWVRVPEGTSSYDELRLLVLPRNAMPGVLGIEVACGTSASAVGYTFIPEVWLRVSDGSFAAERIDGVVDADRTLPGRRPEERAVRVLPKFPTASGTADLVRELGGLLADRRINAKSKRAGGPSTFRGPERRKFRPNQGVEAGAHA